MFTSAASWSTPDLQQMTTEIKALFCYSPITHTHVCKLLQTHSFTKKVVSHPVTDLWEWKWSCSCLFWRLRRSLGKIGGITEKVWRSESSYTHIFFLSILCWKQSEKMPSWCDTSKEENRIKHTSARCHPHTIPFMNCVTAARLRNGTASHCNQLICTHSINLLPVGRVSTVLLVPPPEVREKLKAQSLPASLWSGL